jgi:hypothetical protein
MACLLGEFEGGIRVVGGCDDIATPVCVDLYGADSFADLDVEVCLEHAGGGADAIEAGDRDDPAEGEDPGAGGEKADREWSVITRFDHRVADYVAARLGECDLDQVDAGAEPDEVSHLSGRNAGGDFYDEHLAGVGGEQLRESDAVAKAERADGIDSDLACRPDLCRPELRGVAMDPADPEAWAGRAESIGQGEQSLGCRLGR